MRIPIGDSTKLGHLYFRKSFPRNVYNGNKRTDEQAKNEDGVLLWAVRAELTQDGGKTVEDLTIVVPLDRDPAEGLMLNEEIAFRDVVLSSGQRQHGGRWERLEASGIIRRKRDGK